MTRCARIARLSRKELPVCLGPYPTRRLGCSFLFAALITMGCLLFEARRCQAEEPGVSFSLTSGEVLRYNVRWGAIPAAYATLEVLPLAEVNGQRAHHFVMTARTNSFADFFYRYRNQIHAYADLGMIRSLRFHKREEERKRHRDVDVLFDWSAGETRITEQGQSRVGVTLVPGTFDPLVVMYVFRTQPLEVGAKLRVPVSDGRKLVQGVARVKAREEIRIQDRIFDCFLVEPDLQDLGGVFRKSPEATLQIWVTADDLRLPVRVRSKVVVGHFTADLDLDASFVRQSGSSARPEE